MNSSIGFVYGTCTENVYCASVSASCLNKVHRCAQATCFRGVILCALPIIKIRKVVARFDQNQVTYQFNNRENDLSS